MATSLKPSVTVHLLEKYFAIVKNLRTYLAEILELPSSSQLSIAHAWDATEADSIPYHDLLSSSYVALKVPSNLKTVSPRFKVFPVMIDMREIIDRAQEKIFKSKASQQVITAGYRLARKDGDRGKQGMGRAGITNYFVNTIITALQAPEWDTLLQRIGADAMLHLLTETHLFVSLPNDCLCQMTGEPMIHMAPVVLHSSEQLFAASPTRGNVQACKRPFPFPDAHQDERQNKRRKIAATTPTPLQSTGMTVSKHSPADILLVRARLLYARPRQIPHTTHIIVGLSDKHVLNRLDPAYHLKPKVKPHEFVDPDPKEQVRKARHLSKYVFPRQYGLSSPFVATHRKKEIINLPDYSDRELEIKTKGSCKTPKRLKDTLYLLETMIWRHGKCGYKPLRDKACPSKLKTTGNKDVDSTIILELMSEEHSQLRTQASFGAYNVSVDSGNSILPLGLTQAEAHAKAKPRFAEFCCSNVEVYRYVALVTKAVIPKAFWGCNKNFKLILHYVEEFINCRRFETLSLHHILQGFSTSECDWLMPPGTGARNQTRISVTDALKRRELLEDFVFWYFDSFVSSLLKTNFYITESSAFRNRVLYFRQDDWRTLCAPLIERLTTGTFEKIPKSDAKELLRQRKLGFSFVRLLPKDTGVRPIVNLRRRKPIQGVFSSERSINQILQAAFQILTYEKQTQSHLLGASVFSPDEIYSKLKEFKFRLPRNNDGTLPKLYFVKVDVQACFDTIEQTKLLEILRELISEDVYLIQRYGQVRMTAGRIKRAYVKKALPEDEHPHFLKYASDLADALRHTIFVDQVVYPNSKKREILQLLEEHITENIVKIGQDYFRQIVGIPQGSILSALLCCFFYGDLEKRFGQYKDDLQSILLRLIDDYLFITTNLSRAKGFLDMMHKGHPEYGCFISKEKTLTNFDYDSEVLNVTGPKQQAFPWCGYMINMSNLSVTADYSRYYGTDLRDTLTVDRGRRPGAVFSSKMHWLARAKSHPIFSDADLNTDDVVYLNIYQNFLLCAYKMHSYMRDWGLSAKKNAAFIHGIVQNMIHVCYLTTRSRAARKKLMTNKHGHIRKVPVVWLGTHAFHTVLSRKPQRYASLLRSLSFELSQARHRSYRKRFRRLVQEGQAGLSQIIL